VTRRHRIIRGKYRRALDDSPVKTFQDRADCPERRPTGPHSSDERGCLGPRLCDAQARTRILQIHALFGSRQGPVENSPALPVLGQLRRAHRSSPVGTADTFASGQSIRPSLRDLKCKLRLYTLLSCVPPGHQRRYRRRTSPVITCIILERPGASQTPPQPPSIEHSTVKNALASGRGSVFNSVEVRLGA